MKKVLLKIILMAVMLVLLAGAVPAQAASVVLAAILPIP